MPTFKTKWFSITWGQVAPDTVAFRNAVFCDAGRRARGRTRVRVTDCNGNPYCVVAPEGKWNEKSGNLVLPEGRNVPYGELLGCYLALKVAIQEKKKYVAGDHDAAINIWSRGLLTTFLRRKKSNHVRKLAEDTSLLRKQFEAMGGEVVRIRGSLNPADLRYL